MLAQCLHKCLISLMQVSRTAEAIYTKGGKTQVMGSHPSQKLPQQQLKDSSFGNESPGKERLLPAQTAYNKKPQQRAHSTNPKNELGNQPAETTSDYSAPLNGWDIGGTATHSPMGTHLSSGTPRWHSFPIPAGSPLQNGNLYKTPQDPTLLTGEAMRA